MRVSIVEDDSEQREYLAKLLRAIGHTVHEAASAEEFQRQFPNDTSDLILMDWNLPGKSGLALLKWLRNERRSMLPVVVITVRSAADDIVAAFDAGADDFLSKPVDKAVLMARLSAICRRSHSDHETASRLSVGRYEFDVPHERLRAGHQDVPLTRKEFLLALALFTNLGRPLSRRYLFDRVWKSDSDRITRTLDAYISTLRNKLCLDVESGFNLTAIYGYGYRLDAIEGGIGGTHRRNESVMR
jgi:DNA-binding response OmpR family regulator